VAAALVSQQKMIAESEANIRSAEARVAVNQGALAQARANLTQVAAGPRGVDIAALQADARSAEANYLSALSRLEKARMTAPIAGKVTAVNNKAGEQIAAGAAFIVIQNIEGAAYELKVDISESDIAKVSLADAAIVTFDALGETAPAAAAVRQIDPAEKLVESVVYYEVTLEFSGVQPPAIKPGMTADVEINTARLSQVIVIPQRAVLRRPSGQEYVRVVAGDTYEEREVQTGLRGDGGRVEVRSGLNEGEEIVVSIKASD
jgi:RND family efflux transporter MFP subunit